MNKTTQIVREAMRIVSKDVMKPKFVRDQEANANYVHIVEMTHEEKVKMYMKCTKKNLVEMLIECNRLLPKPSVVTTKNVYKKKVK